MENSAAFFCFSVRRMDKGHLTFRHACGQQLCFDVIINIELPIVFRGRKITEQQLCQFLLPAVLPDLQHIPHTGVQFAGRVIGQQRIHQPLVKADFPAVIRDAEHVVLGRIHSTGMHLGCTLTQILHHFFLDVRRFYNHRFKLCFRHREMKLVAGLDICCFFEHRHQFRQVEELRKTSACTVSGAFGLDFVKRFSVIFLNSSGCLQGSPL